MTRTHGGQQYNYQFLTAITFALSRIIELFSIEGENYDDSVFYRGISDKIIAEAKLITSKRHWTPTALFYKDDKKDSLLQLWERWDNQESLVVFSSIPPRKDIKNNGGISIEDFEI